VRRRPEERNADAFALAIGNAAEIPVHEQFEAADVQPATAFIGMPRSIIVIITGA
jgi:hypothetical protein